MKLLTRVRSDNLPSVVLDSLTDLVVSQISVLFGSLALLKIIVKSIYITQYKNILFYLFSRSCCGRSHFMRLRVDEFVGPSVRGDA